jgi:putative flippase GtrA
VHVAAAAGIRATLRDTWRVLLKELSAFGVVGAINFALDVALFQFMYVVIGADALVAKIVSTSITTTTAYFMHRHWSFAHRERTGIRREYPIFFLVNALTLALSLVMIGVVRYPLGQTSVLVLQLTNIASIAIGTVIRFLAYKRWVFPPRT